MEGGAPVRWRWMACMLLVWACLLGAAGAEGVNRALLVGCDRFLTQENTAPSSENNVVRVAAVLGGGAMNLENLVTRRAGVPGAEELKVLIDETFADADERDVSYFYISTHGVWRQGSPNGEMTLLLSDGLHEEGLTAVRLRELFDGVPGTKVLMIDACHSGAMIGKGVQDVFDNVFAGDSYKVLCSSGGAEESWFWASDTEERTYAGEGYFSGMLVNALSWQGGFAADDNRDGEITWTELKRYLRRFHGESTVQSYPEEDEFPVLTYDAASVAGSRRASVLENVYFEDDALSAEEPQVNFSFTMLREAQVGYQLVYQRGGRWDFDHARLMWDNAERFGVYGDVPGILSPGLKERTIELTQEDTGSYGYVLLQVMTMDEGKVSVAASQVLCVPPKAGDPRLSVTVGEAFCPENGEEMTFVVNHAFPCELSVTVETPEGELVRRLTSRQATRPEQLLPTGSSFTWSGLSMDGEQAPVGAYVIHVRAYVGGQTYEAWSAPVLLASGVQG